MDSGRIVGLAGMFDEPAELVQAAERVRRSGWRRWDCHTPYPVHGLDRAMGLAPSPVGRIAVAAGLAGGALGLLMQWWLNAVAYPLRIGGKPLFSWPAFVPITFEMFVLFAALATTLAATFLCRLWRWHSPLHDSGVMEEACSRRLALVLETGEGKDSLATARRLLAEAGCRDVRELFDRGGEGRILG
jgi:hypothetical protein